MPIQQSEISPDTQDRQLSFPTTGREVSRKDLELKGPVGQSSDDTLIELAFYGPGGDYVHRIAEIAHNPWRYKADFELKIGNYYIHYRYHLRNGTPSYWYNSGVFTVTE
ncbi:hypothetical protein ACIPIN_28110 [Pseudomonas sp. NPDC087697]|uniref:hypothetical protein n=1 Tax=Pseudomonas sp. NPDC087697 TaxID=3364447 RepID=UPI00380DFD64